MIVRELVALLSIKSDKAGMDKANSGLGGLVAAAKAAAAAIAAIKVTKWAIDAAKDVARLGDEIDKTTLRSGIARQEFQEWGFVAELAGASTESMVKVIKRLQLSVHQAGEGSKIAKDGFKSLGIETKDANGELKTATDLLPELADSLGQMENSTKQAALAQELLGKSGIDLIPMLKLGSAAIKEQALELHELGAVMSDELIDLSVKYTDNVLRMDKMFLGIKFTIAEELLPIFIDMQEATLNWWKANKLLISQHIGPIFKGVGTTVSKVAAFFGGLASDTLKFIDNLSGTEKAILGVGAAIVVIGALIAAGPIGKLLLLAAVIALIIEDFQVWREGGKSAIGEIIKLLNEWLGFDIEEWFAKAKQLWDDYWSFFDKFYTVFFTAIYAMVDLLINVWDDPARAWEDFLFQMTSVLDDVGWDFRAVIKLIISDFKEYFSGFGSWWGLWWDNLIEGVIKKLKELDKKITGGALGKGIKFAGKLLGEDEFEKPGMDNLLQGAVSFGSATSTPPILPPVNISNTVTNEITVPIQNAKGLNENQVGQMAAEKVNEVLDRNNRKTLNALLPKKVG